MIATNSNGQLSKSVREKLIGIGDVHGGAVAAGFGKTHRGSGAVAVGFGKNRRGSGSIFFEDIEKLHEFCRISVFTNETP